MVYGDFKDLNRGTTADKVLHDKAFIQNIMDTNMGMIEWFIIFLIKKNTFHVDKSISSEIVKNEIISNKELANELNKLMIRTFKKKKSTFIDNIWGTDPADMQLISKFDFSRI